MNILESESLHHKNFYLREGYDDNKYKLLDQQWSDKLNKVEPKLEKLVKDTADDI